MSRRWDALKPSPPATATSTTAPTTTSSSWKNHHRPNYSNNFRQEKSSWKRPQTENVSNYSRPPSERPRFFGRQEDNYGNNDEWNKVLNSLSRQLAKGEKNFLNPANRMILQEDLRKLFRLVDTTLPVTNDDLNAGIITLLDLLETETVSSDDRPKDIQNQILELLIRLLRKEPTLHLDAEKLQKYLRLFQQGIRNANDTQIMICFTNFVRASLDELKSEITARDVVGGTFLKALESDHSNQEITNSILKTLNALVLHPGHGSAILAPLMNIGDDGREEPVVNPLRQRLFRILQGRLLAEPSMVPDTSNIEARVSTCECLTSILTVTKKLDGTVGAPSLIARRDVDMGILERFFLESLSGKTSDLLVPSLKLLLALNQRYPESSSGVGAKLLSIPAPRDHGKSTQNNSNRCNICSCSSTELPRLLWLIHAPLVDSPHNDASRVAILCVAELLENMPFHKWFVKSTNTPRRGPAPISGFGRRIIESLKCVINVTRCQFQSRNFERHPHPLAKLTIITLSCLPYNDPALRKEGARLWSTLASLILDQSLSDKSLQYISSLLVDSAGGKVLPDGSLSAMCEPAKVFLSNRESSSFVDHLSRNLSSSGSRSNTSTRILKSLVRTRPQLVNEHWKTFSEGMERLFNQNSFGVSIDIFEGLMLGRKDFSPNNEEAAATKKLAGILHAALCGAKDQSSVRVKCLLLQTYSALLRRDWDALSHFGDCLDIHLNFMLSHCSDNFNAKVRSAACKAAGDFCSSYVPTCAGADADTVCRLVSRTFLRALEAKDHSVRCMALFGFGNLAMSIVERNTDTLPLSVENILEISRAILGAFDDANDKVCGNAIRSIGHVGTLLFCVDIITFEPDQQKVVREHYQDVIQKLSGKLQDSLVSISNQKSNLTWKQRSAAKKHGWGTCNSLGLLLKSRFILDAENRDVSLLATSLLTECMQYYTSINEKVFLAALNSLIGIDCSALSEVSLESSMVGRALSVVVLTLPIFNDDDDQSRMSEKIQKQIFSLLVHLLKSATTSDIALLFQAEGFDKEKLEHLYEWMVHEEIPAHVFESFSKALQHPGISIDSVALEQALASRALYQEKKEQQQQQILTSEDGDDDEL